MSPDAISPPPVWTTWLLILLAVLVWAPSIPSADYSFDDVEGVLENPTINGSLPAWRAFGDDYWAHRGAAGHYRPLAQLSLAADVWLADRVGGARDNAWVLRTSALFWHVLLLAFGARLACRWLPARQAWAAQLGLALFAIHPVQADAVAWISGRSSMWALLPGVIASYGLARGAANSTWKCALAIAVATVFGLLGKEDGYLSGLLVLAVAWTWRTGAVSQDGAVDKALTEPLGTSSANARNPMPYPAPAWRRALCLFGLTVGLAIALGLRMAALGDALPHAPHAPLQNMAFGQRLLSGGSAMWMALGALAWPVELSPAFRLVRWPLATPLALLGWSTTVGLGVAAWRWRAEPRGWLFALTVAAWLPFWQVLPTGEVFALRFLYMPLFFLGLVGLRPQRVTWLAVALAIPLAWRSAEIYTSRGSYALATLATAPQDARAMNDLGVWHLEHKRPDQAQRAFENALASDPTYGRPHSNLGALALERGDLIAAQEHFLAATKKGPGNPIAFANLGAFALRQNDVEGALAAYQRVTNLAPGMAVGWRGMAQALWLQGEHEAARVALERCLQNDPADARALALQADWKP